MPSLGADMEAGTLVAWHKAAGEELHRGDTLAAVDTDKGVIDVEIFRAGVLEEILVAPGTRVPVGTPLARIREPGEPPEVRICALPQPARGPLAPTPPPTGCAARSQRRWPARSGRSPTTTCGRRSTLPPPRSGSPE